MKRFGVGSVLAAVVVLGFVPDAGATVMFTGTDGSRSAAAKFTISGTTLTVLLSNTDTAPTGGSWVPNEILTGLFFNLGTSSFTPQSATVAANAIAQQASCTPACTGATTNVAGEWGYSFGPITTPGGAVAALGVNQGIASAGYLTTGAVGNRGNFSPNLADRVDLDGNVSLNGIGFGIVPTGFVDNSGNGGVDGRPLIKGAATFVLTLPTGLKESDIANVYFQYGTSITEPRFQGKTGSTVTTNGSGGVGSVPEPSSLAALGVGLAMIAAYRRRQRA